MQSNRTKLALLLLILAAALHLFRLSEPRAVVFDEVHFGGFVNAYCCSGSYFLDIHPPHGKLLIAGAASLLGYRGGSEFEQIGDPSAEATLWAFRLVPALAGSVLPVLIFAFLLQLGASRAAAFLAGLAVLLDNALLLQTRIIALDGILLAATFGALCAFLAAQKAEGRIRRSALSCVAGALAGLALGTKFTGLVAGGLIAVCLAVDALGERSRARLRVLASQAVWVLSGAVSVYAAGWALHYGLLTEPGPGDIWGVPTGDGLADTVQMHRTMWSANYGLAKSHPYASPWWSWPLMLRPIFYWRTSGDGLYFLGNPVLWWGASLMLAVAVGHLVWSRGRGLASRAGGPPWPKNLWLPALGYTVSLAPLTTVPRPLFLYHYLTPLLFGVCIVACWLDHVGWTRPGGWREQRLSIHLAALLLVVGFLATSPFTFAFVRAPAYQDLVFELFPGWR